MIASIRQPARWIEPRIGAAEGCHGHSARALPDALARRQWHPTRRFGCAGRSGRQGAICAAAAIVLAGWCGRAALADSVWEMLPYRVQVIVAVAPSPEWQPQLEADLCGELAARSDVVIGAMWDVAASVAPPTLRARMLAAVETVAFSELPRSCAEMDKVMLVAVTAVDAGYHVTARELDVRTQTWGTPVRRRAWQAAKLRNAAFHAVVDAFSPLARIDRAKESTAVLRPRGSGLPVREAAALAVRPGRVFRPVVRRNDRDGNLAAVTQIPWTFLTAERVAATQIDCRIYTGLRNPLSSRRRGRIEWLALAVIPPQAPTLLTLQSRTDPKRVLCGYDVVAHPPGSKTTVAIGRTDGRGAVTVRPAEHPLRLLVVSSGGVPLARLPVVPGLESQLTAAVANDDERLVAEGFVAALQERMVDLVTRREVLMTRVGARVEAQKLDEAAALVEELESLEPVRQALEQELAKQRQWSVSSDAVIQAKIDALFGDTEKLFKKHLDTGRVEQLARQVRQAREGKR
jgi:hypothetical protein